MAPKGLSLLLEALGWSDPERWWGHWQQRGGFDLASCVWPENVNDEWLLGVAFPLLSQVESLMGMGGRPLLGLSALPGCGKPPFAIGLCKPVPNWDGRSRLFQSMIFIGLVQSLIDGWQEIPGVCPGEYQVVTIWS